MFIAKKDNQYWLWSSKEASLDCMPQYKSNSAVDARNWAWKKRNGLLGKALTPSQVRLMNNYTNESLYGS